MNRKELIREYKEMKKDMGVCLLTCSFTGSEYLLSTVDVEARKNRMNFELFNAVFHQTPRLDRESKQFGKAGFTFSVISLVDRKKERDLKDEMEELELLLEIAKEKYPNALIIK